MWETAINISLAAILLAAVLLDWRKGRIPNAVTLPALLLGIALNGAKDGAPGAMFSVAGIAAGVGMLLLPFMMGGMGGGDVKLLATVGALKGPSFVFIAFLCAAIAGGIVAAARLALKPGERREVWSRLRFSTLFIISGVVPDEAPAAGGAFPYAVCIAAGAACAFPALPFLLPG